MPRVDADALGHPVPVGRRPAPAGATGDSAPVRQGPAGVDPSAAPVRPTPALEARLAAERVAWLTTVRPDGRPHVVPIWFSWDGQAFLVYSKPHARKVENLRQRPFVMLAFGDADADFDVILAEGRAELVEQPACPPPVDHFTKYAAAMAAIDLGRDEYVRTYSLAIRVTPTRFLPWSGRSHLDERRADAGGPDRTTAPASTI